MQEKVLKILEFNKIIYKLTAECMSSLGKELAENLFPSSNFDEILINQHETSQAVSMVISRGNPPFGGLKDIINSINKANKGAVLAPNELLEIADTLRASRNLKAYFGYIANKPSIDSNLNYQHKFERLQPIFEGLYTNKRVEDKIYSCIINEEEIADTASPALQAIRRQIKDSEHKIKEKLNSFTHSSTYQKYLQENLVTIRDGRYVIPVKQEYRNEISGLIHDSSASGATLFIEPMVVVEANNAIKQLKIKEKFEIEKILSELSSMVSEIYAELEENIQLLAKLDFIFAKARLSLNMNAMEPQLNQNGNINIKKARHPLLDASIVVPIDVWCGDKFNTLVVTGPNTGGKTVTLKTIGLLTLMAQAGLHIPASDGSEVNVFHNVFADIGDEQSIEQNLSTFSSHMVNIVQILKNVDSNSLVLLDELGSGTDPVEGAAIAMSVLEYLHKRNARTIATTHYSELKSFAINTEGIENACCEFDIETLRPTYKILIGVPGKSNAFAISKKLGLSDEILEKAKGFVSKDNTRFEDTIAEIEKNKTTSQKQLKEIELTRGECQKLKEQLESEKEAIDKRKDKLIREAREEARSILQDAKVEADKTLAEIKNLAEEHEESERNKKGENLKNKLRKKLKETEEALVEPLFKNNAGNKNYKFWAGDTVYILSLKQEGTVLSEPDMNNNVLIQAGIIKLKIPTSQIRPTKHEKIMLDKINISKVTSNKDRTVSMELDLRGQNLEEALQNTDQYLDNASLSGLNMITLIHGKGTGILRNGIHQFLKRHPHVKTFRLGKYGEGEHGVTVVELN